MERWPVFICYRQSDGIDAAERVYELLKDQPIRDVQENGDGDRGAPARLDVYFDQAAPGVGDWTSVHEPYLKRCRAMIVVCTPGAKLVEGADDWVHKEIDWWIENRQWAPILIDPLGAGARYVPDVISAKWPNAQRIDIIAREWDALAADRRQALEERTRERLIGGIATSARTFYRDELEQELKRASELRVALESQQRLSRILKSALAATIVLLIGAFAAGIFAYTQQRLAEQRGADLEVALRNQQAASVRYQLLSAQHLLATGRAVEAAAGALDLNDLVASLTKQHVAVDADPHTIDGILFAALDRAAPVHACRGGASQLRDIAFSPSGEFLLAASSDGKAYLWQADTCDLVRTIDEHSDIVSQVAWSPDGKRYLTASWDRSAVLHDAQSGAEIRKFVIPEGRFLDVQFAPDGKTLVTVSSGGALDLWNLANGEDTALAPDGVGRPKKVVFSPDGKLLLEMTSDRTAPVWDYPARKVRLIVDKQERAIVSGRFSADGQRLLSGSDDGSAKLLSTADGAEVARLGKRDKSVIVTDLSPDQRRALLASEKTAEIWTLDPPVLSGRVAGDADLVKAEFLADGMVVSGDLDGNVRIWEADSHDAYLAIKGKSFTNQVYTVSKDRSRLAVIVGDGAVQVQRILTDSAGAEAMLCATVRPAYAQSPGADPALLAELKKRCAPAS